MTKFKNALLISAIAACATSASAATVTYGDAYNIGHTGITRVLNSFDPTFNGGVALPGSSSVLSAVSYGGNGAVTVNSVNFAAAGGSNDFWGNTGIDPNIDTLLSGHTNTSGTSTPFTLNLTGLTIGNVYQVQLIGIHDSRGGSIGPRQYEASFGGSDFTSQGDAPILTRNAYGNNGTLDGGSFDGFASYGTVVGLFIADATTQQIQLRSNQQDGNLGDDVDPGLSGYALIDGGAASQTYSLIDEEFTGGAQPANTSFVTWSDDDSSANFESYNSGGAGVRDMNDNYDHDQDGGTGNITIPGGLEVNDDAGPVELTAELDLSSLAGHTFNDSSLTFFAGMRGGNRSTLASIEILNITDNTTVLAETTITINANDNIWEFNEFTGFLDDDDAGDTLQVIWNGGGSGGADGLQLADIELTASTIVPEPSSLALLGLGGLLILRRSSAQVARRRRG